MRSILKLRSGEDSGVESDGEEATDDDDDDDDDELDDEEDDTSSSAIDYAAILEKVTDVTNNKVIPAVGKVADITKDRIIPLVMKYSKKGAVTAKKTSLSVYQAFRRAISAAFEEEAEETDEIDDDDDDDEGGEITVMEKILKISKKSLNVMRRMVKAALTVPPQDATDEEDEVDEDDGVTSESDDENKEAEAGEVDSESTDFGSYLAKAYGVEDERKNGGIEEHTILGGSLQDALKTARNQARMLLVFVPSKRPEGEKGGLPFFGGGKKGDAESNEYDRVAIESLLSSEVGEAANKKARKNQGKEKIFGSFALWGGKAGSSEAASVTKQLKIKETSKKGGKRPILCAVYPAIAATVSVSPSCVPRLNKEPLSFSFILLSHFFIFLFLFSLQGSEKMVPKVLAQHHCNPPMKAKSMASWMNSLRKRHGKQYQKMQTDLKELELYQERKEGYIDSVQNDKERKLKEAQEEAERKAQEMKEAARQAEIDERRQELQESLPEDLKKGSNVKKIALRFPDGRSGQRGFSSDQPLSVVFNWVDAAFEIERETVILTSLNGKQTFSWSDDETENGKTLEDAGLNKMTAFRVTTAQKNSDNHDAYELAYHW